jgi:hypothetical protein
MEFVMAQNSRIGRKAMLGSAMAVVVIGGSAVALAANAAEGEVYDQAQLLNACNEETDLYGKADKCRFEPATYDPFTADLKQVSGVAKNCGSEAITQSVSWSDTTSETNSIEVSVTAKANIFDIISVSVSTAYGHSWTQSSTKTDGVLLTIPPGSAGAVFRGSPMAKVTGRMVINFTSRKQGHFEWYAYPELTVPAEDQPKVATLITNTRPLNDEEKSSCPVVPAGEGTTAPPSEDIVVQQGEDPPATVTGQLNPSEQFAAG